MGVMNWSLSGVSGTGIAGCRCTPSVHVGNKFFKHPEVWGVCKANGDLAFQYMHERLSVEHYHHRPFLFISLHLPRAARRRLRAMPVEVRRDCMMRMGSRDPGGSEYLRSMRAKSYMEKRRGEWDRYIETGVDASRWPVAARKAIA